MNQDAVNAMRALFEQGVGMGWGDEGEAWLRSKLNDEDYHAALNDIHRSYGQFAKEHPYAQVGLELGGAALPAVGALLVPGAQGAAPATIGGTLARLGLVGAATGALSSAGASDEGNRLAPALMGGVLGAATGLATPALGRIAGGVGRNLAERFMPTEQRIERRAGAKMLDALQQSGASPADITSYMQQSKDLGVPSMVLNANPKLTNLAEAISARSGEGSAELEKMLAAQQAGSRERAVQQVRKGLSAGDYYDDLANLQQGMRERANEAYQKAYADGVVTDPKVLSFLKLPQFQQGAKETEKLLAAEGRKFNPNKLTVETLDQIKRGVDSLIEKNTDPVTGKVTALGRAYIDSKNKFLKELDRVSPDYWEARKIYAGDAETANAMRSGLNDFGQMHHEEVAKKIAGMSEGEKEAFRTGVARNLYGVLLNPSQNINAGKRIIGSPEMRAKLRPLFDDPAKYDLFEAALKREQELTEHASDILRNSRTAKRQQMVSALEGDGDMSVVADAVHGGFANSLTKLALGVATNAKLSAPTAKKLASMLTSKDPQEVATVVALLERTAKQRAPAAIKANARTAGLLSGTIGASAPAPLAEDDTGEDATP